MASNRKSKAYVQSQQLEQEVNVSLSLAHVRALYDALTPAELEGFITKVQYQELAERLSSIMHAHGVAHSEVIIPN